MLDDTQSVTCAEKLTKYSPSIVQKLAQKPKKNKLP